MDVVSHDIDMLIQNGWAWRLEYSATVGAGATHNVGLTTGTDQVLVLDRAFASDADNINFRFYRQTPFSAGADITLKNRNDNFWAQANRAPFTVCRGGVTATPNANDLMASLSLVSTKKTSAAGTNGVTIVLAPNSSYVLAITNNDAAPKIADFAGLIARYGMRVRM